MKTKAVIITVMLASVFPIALWSGAAGDKSGAADTQSSADAFVQWSENGHFYKAVYVPEGISWTAAKAAAEQAGGYLATITSSKENDFVFELIDKNRFWKLYVTPNLGKEYLGPWIGGYQEDGAREPDSGWKWVNGEKFRYKKWCSGEPTGLWGNRNENRLHYYNVGSIRPYWNDAPDSTKGYEIFGYIIEKEKSKLPE